MSDNIKIKNIHTSNILDREETENNSAKIPQYKAAPKSNARIFSTIFILLASLTLGLGGGVFGHSFMQDYAAPRLLEIPYFKDSNFLKNFLKNDKPVIINKEEKITITEESAVIDSIAKVQPSVVSIVASRDVRGFFGEVFQQKGGGTGFIITSDGLIATNKHVVFDEKAEYTVITNNGKKYSAKVLARDPSNDLAIVKIEENNLPVVELGESKDLKTGQRVIAIGNSLGEYNNTATTGIISGIDRTIIAGDEFGAETERLEGAIQTDAAINPGNSGGPLVNLKGQVIGINTAIDREGQLIGFAIPIDTVRSIIDSVIKTGKIIRPMLGIRYIPITPELANLNNLPVKYGALIYSADPQLLAVLPNSPASKAGLKQGDIILKIGEQQIDENHNLSTIIQKYKPEDEVDLTILRDNETVVKKIVLMEMKI